MSEAREIELEPVAERAGGIDLVVVSPNDPEAMQRHTDESRQRGYAFAADPSQQLTFLDGEQIRRLVEGAEYLFCNDYEKGLLESKSGWSDDDVLSRVKLRVTTLGAKGVRAESKDAPTIEVGVVPARVEADPTGVGDAFRAGFLAGIAWQLELERAMQLGSLMATLSLETQGPQEYDVRPDEARQRLADAYGEQAANEIAEHLQKSAVQLG
jgi:adenosine kinase